jgi:hypothetical protein
VSAVAAVLAAQQLDPLAWMATVAPDSITEAFADYQYDLTEWLPEGERQARVVFRGAAKSTLTTALVLWAIRTGRTKGIVWVRATGDDTQIDREAMLRLGTLAGMDVTAVGHGPVIVNGVPVWTKTPKGAVRGIRYVTRSGETVRPDTVIIDDIETRETARSKMQTDRLERWMSADLFATAGHKRPIRVIMLGTPITPTSIIAKAMRRERPYDTWLAPLIVPYLNAEREPAWPAMFDPELERRTEDGAWSNEYMLQPLPDGALMFSPDRTRWLPDYDRRTVWVGVDPAGDGDDATAAVAACSTADGLLIVDALQWRGHSEDAPAEIAAFIRRLTEDGWPVAGVNFEAVGAFSFMANRTANLVSPVPVVFETPRQSKTERALPMARWHKMNAVQMLERLRGTPLDVEMHTWTREGYTVTGHDDLIDSAVWACGAATSGWSIEPPLDTMSISV